MLRTPDNLLADAREAGRAWAAHPIAGRLRVIRATRRLIARNCHPLAESVQRRPLSDTLVSEVLPLAEAALFLERRAAAVLAPRRLWRHRPLWLFGVRAEIRREPVGVVLILAPGNYPLFLPGAQILQAIAAGNAVYVKPAPGCADPMIRFADLLRVAGLPSGVLTVLDDSQATGEAVVTAGFDHIVLTGSADTGRRVLAATAPLLTRTTMELSGNDPVFVLPGADLALVAVCLAYGMRLNGGATCIAPHRVFVPQNLAAGLESALTQRMGAIEPIAISVDALSRVTELLQEAKARGARIIGEPGPGQLPAIVVADTPRDCGLIRSEVVGPILSIVPVADMDDALRAAASCPYALGATIFGPLAEARALATRVNAGAIVINDVIVPTADPRLPFGGRGGSGFGVTRGEGGLLDMTVVKTVSIRRGWFRPHLAAPRQGDIERFEMMIRMLHGGTTKRFFFEEKDQKTFVLGSEPAVSGSHPGQVIAGE